MEAHVLTMSEHQFLIFAKMHHSNTSKEKILTNMLELRTETMPPSHPNSKKDSHTVRFVVHSTGQYREVERCIWSLSHHTSYNDFHNHLCSFYLQCDLKKLTSWSFRDKLIIIHYQSKKVSEYTVSLYTINSIHYTFFF